jgi:hypothetical protein
MREVDAGRDRATLASVRHDEDKPLTPKMMMSFICFYRNKNKPKNTPFSGISLCSFKGGSRASPGDRLNEAMTYPLVPGARQLLSLQAGMRCGIKVALLSGPRSLVLTTSKDWGAC